MDIQPIRTDADYQRALARISAIMDATYGTPEGAELDALATLVEAYETRNHFIDAADPIEAIKFRMEQMGLDRKDLEPFIGSRGRVSEVLSGKRPLSLNMIRRLNRGLGIPAEVLIRDPADIIA